MRIKSIIVSFFSLFAIVSNAQQKYFFLNNQLDYRIQNEVRSVDNGAHLSMRPYLESDKHLNRVHKVFIDSSKQYYWITEKLNRDHLLHFSDTNFFISADALFDFQWGNDYRDTTRLRLVNTRGAIIQGDLGKTISFATSFYENQVKGPKYWDRVTSRGIFPGSGRYKRSGAAYDFAFSNAYVSFTPNEKLNIIAGHDKVFVGNGYRSMLISDNAFNYPFIKATHSFFNDKVRYSFWLARLSTLERIPIASTPEAYFKPKAAAFNYITIKPNNRLEIGLFESAIYSIYKDSVGTTPMHYSAYIPVYGAKTIINGLNNQNNAMLGLNVFYKLSNSIQLYGQLAVDDIKTSKTGHQLGAKYFSAFGVDGLYLQLEYNKAKENLYASDFVRQSYSHYGQELAHPHGAWFDEVLAIAHYQNKKFFMQGKIISAFQKQMGSAYYGADVFAPIMTNPQPEFSHINTLNIQDLQIGYRYNVKTNMYFSFGIMNRVYATHDTFNNTVFIYAGFRTNLNNHYFDF